jgi:hypothetical protein
MTRQTYIYLDMTDIHLKQYQQLDYCVHKTIESELK